MWTPILGSLERNFQLLVLDRPGHGLTEFFDYSGVDFREHAVAFVESFLDSQDLDRVSLIGNSMGGYFSLAFALEYPERVEKLVLIGAPAGIDEAVPFPLRLFAIPGVNSWLTTALSAFRDDDEPPEAPSFLVAQPERIPHDILVLWDLAARLPGVQQSFQSLLEEVLTLRGFNSAYYLRGELDKVTVPTLFIWGEKDGFAPPQSGQEAAEMMANARIEVIPDVAHMPWTEEPELSAELISAFLQH